MVLAEDRRLVTVTGPGGIGKTRLVLEVARRCRDQFRNGVVFVGLADIRDPGLLPNTLAQALGVNGSAENDPRERIRNACQHADLLLVIDNLEHLLEATPCLTDILGSCEGITILSSSRSRLHLSGEHVFEVPPLPTEAAVALFEARARAIAADFNVSDGSLLDIVATCTYLDGLPLAIELAAARIPVLPPSALRERLGALMDLLSDGLRDAPDRQRGMRQTIAWSYDLLGAEEQALFRALAVFEGGFTLEAAAALRSDSEDVLANVTALQTSSLVRILPNTHGAARFRMLETVREYAWEQLRRHGEEPVIRRAHAAYIVALADDTERLWWLSGGLDKLDLLDPEMPNIRAALGWLRETGDVTTVLRLAGSLAPMWPVRGYRNEGRAWLEWGLPKSDGTPPETLVVALRALSWILNSEVTAYRSLVVAQSALRLAETLDDPRNQVASLLLSAIAANLLGLYDEAREWCGTALDHVDRHHDQEWAPVVRCIASNVMGAMYIDNGHLDEAEMWLNQTLELQRSLELRFTPAGHVFGLFGEIARMRGHPRLALSHFLTALGHACDVGETRQIAAYIGSIAGSLAELGEYKVAAKLFGALESYYELTSESFATSIFVFQQALGLPEPWTSMYPEYAEADELRRSQWDRTASIRAVRLDANQARTWWKQGRELGITEMVALATTLNDFSSTPQAQDLGLSSRELEVLRLVAQGLSDREIAKALFISPRTVQNHVQHIYQKINVSSRSAATRWAMLNGIT
jgi:predicted ATPase/DNA-binding CsgD family transcriptional regulator